VRAAGLAVEYYLASILSKSRLTKFEVSTETSFLAYLYGRRPREVL